MSDNLLEETYKMECEIAQRSSHSRLGPFPSINLQIERLTKSGGHSLVTTKRDRRETHVYQGISTVAEIVVLYATVFCIVRFHVWDISKDLLLCLLYLATIVSILILEVL